MSTKDTRLLIRQEFVVISITETLGGPWAKNANTRAWKVELARFDDDKTGPVPFGVTFHEDPKLKAEDKIQVDITTYS